MGVGYFGLGGPVRSHVEAAALTAAWVVTAATGRYRRITEQRRQNRTT